MLADDAGLKLRENVYSMITEEDADVRAAAAEFIVEIYIKSDIEVEWKKQQKREKNTSTASSRKLYLIKGMVELLHVVAHECEDLAHVMAPLLTTMSTMKNYADILDDVDMLCEIMLEEEGDDRGALAHYRRALAADPLYPDLHINLALLYEKLGREKPASEHWRRYLQLDPEGPWSEVARGKLDRSTDLG